MFIFHFEFKGVIKYTEIEVPFEHFLYIKK